MTYSKYANSKPVCWGKPRSYNHNDPECIHCAFQRDCAAECSSQRPYSSYRSSYTPSTSKTIPINDRDEGESRASNNLPAVIEEGERPLERFMKDAVSGGLRGMFYEMWQFWRHYRIR